MHKPFNDRVTRLIAEQSDAKFQADLAAAEASAARFADAGEDLAAMLVAKEHAPLTGDVDKIAAAKAAVKAAEQELAQAKKDHAVLRGDEPDNDSKPVGKPANDVDLSLLATRGQLVDVFGPLTKLSLDWFKKVGDYPDLEAARKIKGTSGRGHSTEPWFCPYEVMRWLATPVRKGARRVKLPEHRGWSLLERNFPRVYSQHADLDPRPGKGYGA